MEFWPEFYENRFPGRNWRIFCKNYDFLSFWPKLRDLETQKVRKNHLFWTQKNAMAKATPLIFTCFFEKWVQNAPISIFFFFKPITNNISNIFQQVLTTFCALLYVLGAKNVILTVFRWNWHEYCPFFLMYEGANFRNFHFFSILFGFED